MSDALSDDESLTSLQEYELDAGIPQHSDPFIQKYMAGRAALIEQVSADVVGADLRTRLEGPGDVVTCYVECTQPGYPGWEWAVA